MMAVKLIIEVVAGVLPGQPEPEFTRKWAITSEQWEKDRDAVIRAYGESREYAAQLENPSRVNWVRRDWVWL